MSSLAELAVSAWSYIRTIGIADAFDILIIAFIIYKLLGLIHKTNTVRLTSGVVVLLLALWLSGVLGLNMINFLLSRAFELGIIALVILFQPELRRLLEKVGSSRLSSIFGSEFGSLNLENAITQSVLACADMSKSLTGALIIFRRDKQLVEQMSTGTLIDAEVTAELLKNIFFVNLYLPYAVFRIIIRC